MLRRKIKQEMGQVVYGLRQREMSGREELGGLTEKVTLE